MRSSQLSPLQQHLHLCRMGKKVQVVFGSPRQQCRQTGVCRINTDVYDRQASTADTKSCPSAEAYLEVDVFGRLQIHFIAASIPHEAYDRQFANGSFHVSDTYQLDSQVVQILGLNANRHYYIAPRNYPLLELGGFLTVSTQLQSKQIVALMAA